MTKLLLLGTHEYDVEGGRKIQEALEGFNPTHVLVQGCREEHNSNLATREYAVSEMRKLGLEGDIKEVFLVDWNNRLRDFEAVNGFVGSQAGVEMDFFLEEVMSDTRIALADMKQGIARRLRESSSVSNIAHEFLLKRHVDKMVKTLGQFRDKWLELGKGPDETKLKIRSCSQDEYERLFQEDAMMYDRLASTAQQNPNSRIATVTNAVHIVREPSNDSLFDRVMRSERFGKGDVERDMVFARD